MSVIVAASIIVLSLRQQQIEVRKIVRLPVASSLLFGMPSAKSGVLITRLKTGWRLYSISSDGTRLLHRDVGSHLWPIGVTLAGDVVFDQRMNFVSISSGGKESFFDPKDTPPMHKVFGNIVVQQGDSVTLRTLGGEATALGPGYSFVTTLGLTNSALCSGPDGALFRVQLSNRSIRETPKPLPTQTFGLQFGYWTSPNERFVVGFSPAEKWDSKRLVGVKKIGIKEPVYVLCAIDLSSNRSYPLVQVAQSGDVDVEPSGGPGNISLIASFNRDKVIFSGPDGCYYIHLSGIQ